MSASDSHTLTGPNGETQVVSQNIVFHEGVTQQQRELLVGQKGVTVWFTGLSGEF